MIRVCFPKFLKEINLKKGKSLWFYNYTILGDTYSLIKQEKMLIKWRDKRDVYAISNIYNGLLTQYEKNKKLKSKPDIIHEYNQNKGGVDGLDQILSYTHMKEEQQSGGKRFFFIFLR